MTLDPQTTALVLIEYQNEFTSPGGVLHGAVAGVMKETDMLANTVKVVAAARKKGIAIMHAPITFAPGYGELTRHPYGILKGVVDGKAFVRGTWGAAIVDALAPAEGDIVIEGKRGLDTFASTNLDFILRSKGIKTVVLGGFLTNCCVESTMRTAYEHGFEVLTLTDCVAGTSHDEHANAIKYDYPMFSKPTTSTDLLAQLALRPVRAGRNRQEDRKAGRDSVLPVASSLSPVAFPEWDNHSPRRRPASAFASPCSYSPTPDDQLSTFAGRAASPTS